jgi:hypothetical protein
MCRALFELKPFFIHEDVIQLLLKVFKSLNDKLCLILTFFIRIEVIFDLGTYLITQVHNDVLLKLILGPLVLFGVLNYIP